MRADDPRTASTDLARTHQRKPPVGRWPDGAPFALFLSHDIDQIHDRELWRTIADLNHIRRVVLTGERGNVTLAARRIARALFRPKAAVKDFETILEIEARHRFPSTFFILHDRSWGRHGARFDIRAPEIHAIAQLITAAGCEIGVHGGYYGFNDAECLKESRQVIADTFRVEPTGVRNHYLRFSGLETWSAQMKAGFSYDATFGNRTKLGPRIGGTHPFWAIEPTSTDSPGLVELPLTVMDVTVFHYCQLRGQDALDAAWAAITPVISSGGVVTLLWHNNYFNEPECADYQWVYEQLLAKLFTLAPWCETGERISFWWRNHGVRPPPQHGADKILA